MKILYMVNYFPPNTGAAALNALKIAECLVKFGHELLILVPREMGKSLNLESSNNLNKISNLKIQYSSSLIKFPLSLIFSHYENMLKFLIKLKKNYLPEIILSQHHPFHSASVCGSYTSKILKLPHIIRSHDIFVDLESHSLPYRIYISMSYPRIYRSIRNCDIFYVTTSEMKKYLLKFKKLKDVNFKIHHNGIDTNQFYPFKNQEVLKDKYGCDSIISFIGLMYLGIHNFIRIIPELKTYKDTHIILIGDGPYRDYILSLTKKLKLNKQVHFLGIKPHHEIPFYVNNSDIGIGRITHKKYAQYCMPTKCLEYMACKKPFITTPVTRDIIKNNDVGLLLKKSFTDKELTNKLITLIEDKNLRKKLGETGIKKIYKKFKWDALMKEFNNDMMKIVK